MSEAKGENDTGPAISFYMTFGCHLCEQARAILMRDSIANLVAVETVDIASSPELVEAYGLRIPLLRRPDTGDELGWPFGESTLLDFLGGEALPVNCSAKKTA